ncbi:hypothetical protein AB0937_37910 [Streptomyces sp. NPDC047880]|uniref:hypothetical protein n=1 Tax=Streptomyces sp. NPDC047880 TaxID=3155626 RepID=UPI0034513A41
MKGAHVIDSGREPVALIGEWHDDPTEHRLDDPLIAELLALAGRRLGAGAEGQSDLSAWVGSGCHSRHGSCVR